MYEAFRFLRNSNSFFHFRCICDTLLYAIHSCLGLPALLSFLFVASRFVGLRCGPIRRVTLRFVTLRELALWFGYLTLRQVKSRYVPLFSVIFSVSRYVAPRYVTLRYFYLTHVALRWAEFDFTRHYLALRCNPLLCVALRLVSFQLAFSFAYLSTSRTNLRCPLDDLAIPERINLTHRNRSSVST